jgi:predicted lipoprotein with Yx(FWY)xxD motif
MRRAAPLNPLRPGIGIALLAAALTALLVPNIAAAKTTKPVAKQAPNTTLERTVLTNLKGHSLYSLSAETNGRFICTGACLATWHPLVVPAGVRPTGPVRLGTIVRPDGRTQVTYKGRPLYSFAGDMKSGDVNGEGIKDVGTWHAAVTGKIAPAPQPKPQPQPEPVYPY